MKINTGSRIILVASPATEIRLRNYQDNGNGGPFKDKTEIPVAYNGVLVSLSPRKTPCIASESRTAGAPSDLNVKYRFA